MRELIKEIGIPLLIFWAIAAIFFIGLIILAVRGRPNKNKHWIRDIPYRSMIIFLLFAGMTVYSSNNLIKQRKEFAKDLAYRKGQMAAKHAFPLIEKKETIEISDHLQSLDQVIGYLDQSIKMDQEPESLMPILLTLAKELKNLRDDN